MKASHAHGDFDPAVFRAPELEPPAKPTAGPFTPAPFGDSDYRVRAVQVQRLPPPDISVDPILVTGKPLPRVISIESCDVK